MAHFCYAHRPTNRMTDTLLPYDIPYIPAHANTLSAAHQHMSLIHTHVCGGRRGAAPHLMCTDWPGIIMITVTTVNQMISNTTNENAIINVAEFISNIIMLYRCCMLLTSHGYIIIISCNILIRAIINPNKGHG